MSKLVIVDSQIIIWGIKEESRESQKLEIERSKTLFRHIDKEELKLIMPTPQLAELLSGAIPEKREELFRNLNKRFQIVPFDNIAAIKFGELLHTTLKDNELREYFKSKDIFKARMKFDCMIVAIAITRGVKYVYTHDSDLNKYARGQVAVLDYSKLAIQLTTDYENEDTELEE